MHPGHIRTAEVALCAETLSLNSLCAFIKHGDGILKGWSDRIYVENGWLGGKVSNRISAQLVGENPSPDHNAMRKTAKEALRLIDICRAEIENPSAGGCAKTEVKAKIGNERAATGVYVNTPLEQESIKPLDSLSSNMRPLRKLVERCAR